MNQDFNNMNNSQQPVNQGVNFGMPVDNNVPNQINQTSINQPNFNEPNTNYNNQPMYNGMNNMNYNQQVPNQNNNFNNQPKKTNNALILIIIIAVVVIGVVGIFLVLNNDDKKSSDKKEEKEEVKEEVKEEENEEENEDDNENISSGNNNKPNTSNINTKEVRCTFDGELIPGVEYTNGEYTYRYKQHVSNPGIFDETPEWDYFTEDGWGVFHNNRSSSDKVTTTLCTYINDKPVVSMQNMFYGSLAEEIDTSSFNTKNVVNMEMMFAVMINAKELDLTTFDTSNVTTMYFMFSNNDAKNINVTSFDTSNVTSMASMFGSTSVTTLDLSGFDRSKVSYNGDMFSSSEVKTVYVRNQKELSSFLEQDGNPEDLEFIIK